MKALLLSAGLGTSLQPLTDYLPKCLMPINGIPLLEYWLRDLTEAEISPILINLHHHAKLVRTYLSNSPFAAQVETVLEEELLMTGGTLLKNREFFSAQPLMMIHGDNLCFCDFRAFRQAHENRPPGTAITMMTFITPTPQTCGIVELDDRGVVQAFHEKVPNPPGDRANAAVYILEPEIVDFLSSLGKEKIDFSTEVLPRYLGRINTFHNDVYHRDIGNIQSLIDAQKIELKNGYVEISEKQVELDKIMKEIKNLAAQLGG